MKKKFLILLIICTVCELFAFKTKVNKTERELLLNKLDSCEMQIQKLRRSGKDISVVEREIEKIKWTLEQTKSEVVTEKESAKEETAQPQLPEKSDSISSIASFFQDYGKLDIMIIVVGAIVVVSIILLIILHIISAIKKKQIVKTPTRKAVPSRKNAPPIATKKKVTAPPVAPKTAPVSVSKSTEQETFEDIKSKLAALNNRNKESNPFERVGVLLKNEESVSQSQPANPLAQESVSLQNEKRVEQPKVERPVAVPKPQPPVEPLTPSDTAVEEQLASVRSEQLQKRSTVQPVPEPAVIQASQEQSEVPVPQTGTIQEQILTALESGEDVVEIAKRMSMSIDQVKLIVRLAGK